MEARAQPMPRRLWLALLLLGSARAQSSTQAACPAGCGGRGICKPAGSAGGLRGIALAWSAGRQELELVAQPHPQRHLAHARAVARELDHDGGAGAQAVCDDTDSAEGPDGRTERRVVEQRRDRDPFRRVSHELRHRGGKVVLEQRLDGLDDEVDVGVAHRDGVLGDGVDPRQRHRPVRRQRGEWRCRGEHRARPEGYQTRPTIGVLRARSYE